MDEPTETELVWIDASGTVGQCIDASGSRERDAKNSSTRPARLINEISRCSAFPATSSCRNGYGNLEDAVLLPLSRVPAHVHVAIIAQKAFP